MTVQEYISAELARLNLKLSDDTIQAKLIDFNLAGSDDYSTSNSTYAKWLIVDVIPEILAMPDISEDSLSIKYDRSAVMKYCSLLAGKIGVPDPFASNDSLVYNASGLW